ncbi:unnamed protein product [Chironomus riparius]|uniref:EF-hand domain-containing family member C2 n=1 Tax=Chironomus riparius TaxID=315576 RepID=A0A9N9RMS7_9DIPT|nr:unnamed protein product [Chironomus riparius]
MNRCTPLTLSLCLGDYPSQFQRSHSSSTFRKSHHFDVFNKVPMLAEGNKRSLSGKLMHPSKSEESLFPRSQHGLVPAWIVFEKQVLRFFGYFKETVPEHRIPYQIRKVKISYFLDDDTIQITELKSESSSQCIVSRQRIRKGHSLHSDVNVSLLDMNVDKTITLLDRVYHITECDTFTRNFLNRLGICVPPAVEIPKDPVTEIRKAEKASMAAKHATSKDFRFAKFLQNDRKVLRFSAYWNDNDDVRNLEVLFHLSDDTFEIKEKLQPNSGRHSNGMFLKRAKLPRSACTIKPVGEENFVVLNVLGKNMIKGRFLKDRREVSFGDSSQYYNETDLQIGKSINVYGRYVVLTDCDGKTREYYQKKYGIEEFFPISTPSSYKPCEPIAREFKYPPYNGWGSFEDSEGNCTGIEPKMPKVNFRKFLEYDKLVIRFGAKMISPIKENNDRLFIISYYLSEDTIAVYELSCRNLGFRGGEFFGKSKFYWPGQDKYTSERPVAYKSQDFYLGAVVNLRNFIFKIVSADLFALKFMEDNKEVYPMSHPHLIIVKIRERLRPIYKDFIACYMTKVKVHKDGEFTQEFIDYEDFKIMLRELLQDEITEQEIVTLCRHFAIQTKKTPLEFREMVRSIVQGEIWRELWSDVDRLKEFIYHLSPNNTEYLNEKDLLKVIRGCRVPLDKAIVQQLFAVLNKNGNNEFEVKDFLHFIDLKSYKATPVPPINPKKNQFHFEIDEGSYIDWHKFIRALDFEDELQTCGD